MRIGIRRNTKAPTPTDGEGSPTPPSPTGVTRKLQERFARKKDPTPPAAEAGPKDAASRAPPPAQPAGRAAAAKPAAQGAAHAPEPAGAPSGVRAAVPATSQDASQGGSQGATTARGPSHPAIPMGPNAKPGPAAKAPAGAPGDINSEMIGRLDSFLDELAEGHRVAMDQVVTWLTGMGDLDREVQRSVEALNPLLQKWSIEICFLLRMHQPRRFGELKAGLPGIGSRTLSQRLKELESQGIVERTVFPEVPVRVEYRLTPKGSRMGDLFLPIIAHLRITAWREENARKGIAV